MRLQYPFMPTRKLENRSLAHVSHKPAKGERRHRLNSPVPNTNEIGCTFERAQVHDSGRSKSHVRCNGIRESAATAVIDFNGV